MSRLIKIKYIRRTKRSRYLLHLNNKIFYQVPSDHWISAIYSYRLNVFMSSWFPVIFRIYNFQKILKALFFTKASTSIKVAKKVKWFCYVSVWLRWPFDREQHVDRSVQWRLSKMSPRERHVHVGGGAKGNHRLHHRLRKKPRGVRSQFTTWYCREMWTSGVVAGRQNWIVRHLTSSLL